MPSCWCTKDKSQEMWELSASENLDTAVSYIKWELFHKLPPFVNMEHLSNPDLKSPPVLTDVDHAWAYLLSYLCRNSIQLVVDKSTTYKHQDLILGGLLRKSYLFLR